MDNGDAAWVLFSTALVMLMAPGLELFYGGMVPAKSVLHARRSGSWSRAGEMSSTT